MARELEDAKVTLKLDTKEAQKALDDLRPRRPGQPGAPGVPGRPRKPGGTKPVVVPGQAFGLGSFAKNSPLFRAVTTAVLVEVLRKVLPIISGIVKEAGRGTVLEPITDAMASGFVGGARGLNTFVNGLLKIADEIGSTLTAAQLAALQAEIGEIDPAGVLDFQRRIARSKAHDRFVDAEIATRVGQDIGEGATRQFREQVEQWNRSDNLFGDKESKKKQNESVREAMRGIGGTAK